MLVNVKFRFEEEDIEYITAFSGKVFDGKIKSFNTGIYKDMNGLSLKDFTIREYIDCDTFIADTMQQMRKFIKKYNNRTGKYYVLYKELIDDKIEKWHKHGEYIGNIYERHPVFTESITNDVLVEFAIRFQVVKIK